MVTSITVPYIFRGEVLFSFPLRATVIERFLTRVIGTSPGAATLVLADRCFSMTILGTRLGRGENHETKEEGPKSQRAFHHQIPIKVYERHDDDTNELANFDMHSTFQFARVISNLAVYVLATLENVFTVATSRLPVHDDPFVAVCLFYVLPCQISSAKLPEVTISNSI